MNVRGYMIEVTLTDEALTVEGTNKPSRIALRGEQHDAGPLVIGRGEIVGIDHKKAGALTNGSIAVRTTSGEKYVLHFRKKSNDEFSALATALT